MIPGLCRDDKGGRAQENQDNVSDLIGKGCRANIFVESQEICPDFVLTNVRR